MRGKIFILALWLFFNSIQALRLSPYPKGNSQDADEPSGEPLFLTPYIDSGQITEGRAAARVTPLKGDIVSYSGYFTVDSRFNSNMFFWFFPSETDPSDAPVVVWLQGGPGATSLYGLFTENGPYSITSKQTLKTRHTYWSQKLNVIYIDNPVGVGFSFTDNDAGYATNETAVGVNLYRTIVQFFKLFPEYQEIFRSRFFVSGESYAGKYVPALAYAIHLNNPTAEVKINLEGIAIGDGWCDPENLLNYGDYLYQLSLIDDKTRETFKQMENEIVSFIQRKNFLDALNVMDNMILDGGLFLNITGISDNYNYLDIDNSDESGDLYRFMGKKKVRKSLHVGNVKFDGGDTAADKLNVDMMQSVKPWLEELMDNYRVLLYNGQLDVIVAYPLTLNMIQKLNWKGKSDYQRATRQLWYVGGELAGYAKTAGNFTEVLVRNAGHMVPGDQPVWALDLITRFTGNVAF